MPFVPSAELIAKLRALPCANKAPSFVRDAVGSEPIYIGGTLAVFWFLTLDGRVLEFSEFDETVLERHGDDTIGIFAMGAHVLPRTRAPRAVTASA